MSEVVLSASRIKLFQTCSYSYYCRYILKLPDEPNDGAQRGNVVHLVLEILLLLRHKKHLDLIKRRKSAFGSPAIHRLILKDAGKRKIADPENLELINEMIMVALTNDFVCGKPKFISAEEAFKYKTDKYQITGFIDKIAIFNNSEIDLYDYKTSKKKFTEEEMDGNLQTLMYSLVTFKTKGVIPQVKFLFLRFPKSPVINAEKCTEEQLEGFEGYLAYLSEYLGKFTLAKATSSYAFNNVDTKWLCGFNKYRGQLTKNGKKFFGCPYKFPFNYYCLVDRETGDPIKSSENPKDLKETDKAKIVYRSYLGCPVWGHRITHKVQLEPDF